MSNNLTLNSFSNFLYAGRAVFTIISNKSDNHLTYRVKKNVDGDKHWYLVYVSKGYNDWLYLGLIDEVTNDLVLTKNSKASLDSISVRTFRFILKNQLNSKLFEQAELKHEGKCGKCGRRLTDPASIEIGLGSECRKFKSKIR